MTSESRWIDQSSDPRVAVCRRRMEAAARSKDHSRIRETIDRLTDRHGKEVVSEAWMLVLGDREFKWLYDQLAESMPEEIHQNIEATGMEIMADILTDAGLRLEDHFRVADDGVMLSKEALLAIAATGYQKMAEFGEGNTLEAIASSGLGRSPFIHRLSEFDHEKDFMNLWACASIVISTSMGWMPGEGATPQAKDAIADLLSVAAPTLDQARLIRQSRYDDRALLKLCSYAHSGLQGKCDRAFEK